MNIRRPLVLCFSGLDPTGGAGIQADIEAIAAAGCHALPIVTALTAQDSRNVSVSIPVATTTLAQQLDLLLADCEVSAAKIGLLGDAGQTRLIASRLASLRIPVVCDPVLRAGGGRDLADHDRIEAMLDVLFQQVTVLTPNASEVRRLAGNVPDTATAAHELLARGCLHVLVTGGDEPEDAVVNVLYAKNAAPVRHEWTRLPETFHGAGCTLASAIAARLARGVPVVTAVADAQRWTQSTLQNALAIGQGRRIPGRFGVRAP